MTRSLEVGHGEIVIGWVCCPRRPANEHRGKSVDSYAGDNLR